MAKFLGNILAQVREKKSETQRTLAQKIGVRERTIQTWEQETSQPGGENLAKLCVFFGVTQDFFYADKNLDGFDPKGTGRVKDHRIEDILNLLKEDPEETDAVFHFLEAKKNFDRASKTMKQYLGKKLETWFEFPTGNDDKGSGQ